MSGTTTGSISPRPDIIRECHKFRSAPSQNDIYNSSSYAVTSTDHTLICLKCLFGDTPVPWRVPDQASNPLDIATSSKCVGGSRLNYDTGAQRTQLIGPSTSDHFPTSHALGVGSSATSFACSSFGIVEGMLWEFIFFVQLVNGSLGNTDKGTSGK